MLTVWSFFILPKWFSLGYLIWSRMWNSEQGLRQSSSSRKDYILCSTSADIVSFFMSLVKQSIFFTIVLLSSLQISFFSLRLALLSFYSSQLSLWSNRFLFSLRFQNLYWRQFSLFFVYLQLSLISWYCSFLTLSYSCNLPILCSQLFLFSSYSLSMILYFSISRSLYAFLLFMASRVQLNAFLNQWASQLNELSSALQSIRLSMERLFLFLFISMFSIPQQKLQINKQYIPTVEVIC